jgi:hypothetical protein
MCRKVILFSLLAWPLCGAQPITGPWRTFSGGQPQFASPAFNDQAWQTIAAPPIYPPRGVITWYRVRTQAPDLALDRLAVPSIFGAYEVFVNGQKVAARGTFGAPFRMPYPQLAAYPIPRLHGEVVIAVRVEVSRVALGSLARYQLSEPEPWLWLSTGEASGLIGEARFRAALRALSSQLPIGAIFALLLMAF